MDNNNKLICRTCNIEKDKETDFRPKRRVCKKCISKNDILKYGHIVKKYYANHQDEICEKNLKYYYEKIKDKDHPRKIGRPRTINVC